MDDGKQFLQLLQENYLPIDVSDRPKVLQDCFRQEVPDLRPHPRRLLDGRRQEALGLFIGVELHEGRLQLWTQTAAVDAVPLKQTYILSTFSTLHV